MTQKETDILRLRKEGLTYKAIGAQLGMTENNVNKRYSSLKSRGLAGEIPAVSSPTIEKPMTGISENELRQKHDMFFIIFTHVKQIPIGKYIEESQLLKELGLYGKARYRDAISRSELKDYKGKVDGTVYYGSVESISKLKSEGVLQ